MSIEGSHSALWRVMACIHHIVHAQLRVCPTKSHHVVYIRWHKMVVCAHRCVHDYGMLHCTIATHGCWVFMVGGLIADGDVGRWWRAECGVDGATWLVGSDVAHCDCLLVGWRCVGGGYRVRWPSLSIMVCRISSVSRAQHSFFVARSCCVHSYSVSICAFSC